MDEIPKPDGNLSQTLHLFSLRGFNERDTFSHSGCTSHNIGKISRQFITGRLYNFRGTAAALMILQFHQAHILTHYIRSLLRGRGLLFADQQSMANEKTATLVKAYASGDGTIFRIDFARAIVKMSNLGVLSGSQASTFHLNVGFFSPTCVGVSSLLPQVHLLKSLLHVP
ncbi:hypothetical protein Pint_18154 [Pistacia integerrima]|uniref:Uncharacterized protein n=1 Tax=Pistacia integerrima TaxID=434235 RepID=A0ACC0YYT1_9ROSI|nr:hypothetical protein Pint_18154 [Pistacia integerrima]